MISNDVFAWNMTARSESRENVARSFASHIDQGGTQFLKKLCECKTILIYHAIRSQFVSRRLKNAVKAFTDS